MKLILSILCIISFLPIQASAASFSSLWKQVEAAAQKDQPKTEMEVLQLIIEKAKQEKAYGHLLKASLINAQVSCNVTPDSLMPRVAELERMELEARNNDPVLAAVYQTVLGSVYRSNDLLGDDHLQKAEEYFKMALANPALLAKHKAAEYTPFVIEGYDAKWFKKDLLSVIGYQIGDYKTLHEYYRTTNMREAACLTAVDMLRTSSDYQSRTYEQSAFIQSIDSLIAIYGDTKVAGELAVARFQYMDKTWGVKAEEKINYIHEALSRWGKWPRMNVLRNAEKRLTQPTFSVGFGSLWNLPGQPRRIKRISVRNIDQLTLTVSRLALDASRDYNLNDDEDYAIVSKAIMKENQVVLQKSYAEYPDYEYVEDSLEVPALSEGVYLVEVATSNSNIKPQRFIYYVSDLQVVAQSLPDEKIRFVVVKASSGHPIPGAAIRIHTGFYNKGKYEERSYDYTCDNEGEYIYQAQEKNERIKGIFASTVVDKYCPENTIYGYYSFPQDVRPSNEVRLYTDRSIYRPGQEVHVGVICYRDEGRLTANPIQGQKIELALRDANHKVVETKTVETDAYGKASAVFNIPEQGLTGRFSIDAKNTSVSIRVEQYKRPTFEVEFPGVHDTYQVGDTVMVKGIARTYSGVPVQGAEVKYTVTRRVAWWWHNEDGNNMIHEGTAVTDDEGVFHVEMPMLLPEDMKHSICFYQIVAKADVTDKGGETHAAEIALPVGSKATWLSVDLPYRLEKDSLKTIRFDYKNMAGADIDAEVTYYIDGSNTAYTAATNKRVPLPFAAETLTSGEHTLMAVCGEDTIKRKFTVFSLDDTVPWEKTHKWFYTTASTFPADGSPVYVQVGSSDPDVYVVYTYISNDKVVEKGAFRIDNSINRMAFNYKEEYGDGILLTYAWVKDGEVYEASHTIRRPSKDKRLLLQWNTFRDRLVPGQKEEWSLKVTHPDGTPADAQLMAVLYDKSLEQLLPHGWGFSLRNRFCLPTTKWGGFSYSSIWPSAEEGYKRLDVPSLKYSRFDDLFTLQYFRHPVFLRGRLNKAAMGVMPEEYATVEMLDDQLVEAKAGVKSIEEDVEQEEPRANEVGGDAVQLRENLNETAFFMPTLVTDNSGNVVMKFTLPESVTTWRFMALANDKEMNFGQTTAESVAQKDVMVQPNVPRFLRTGDKATLVTRIHNTTEKKLTGKATLTLIDPETEKAVLVLNKNYTLEPGKTENVSFEFQSPKEAKLYVCRVVAAGKGYSDGEQHYLPILPDYEMVTRSYPFTQHGPGRVAVKLDKLFAEGIKDGKLTVEYTNNPAWLVIQSMPRLAETHSKDVVTQAASFFANTVGSYLMNLTPLIKETVTKWQEAGDKEPSLSSNLQNNQELKDLVLSETPWVLTAENEAAQKRELIRYFDTDALNMRQQEALHHLRSLQLDNGAWTWWPDMPGSIYLTSSVAEILVRVNHLVGNQTSTTAMLRKAFGYLGDYLIDEMKEMKKQEKKGEQVRPSETAVRILYTFALDGRQQPSKVQEAQKYMVKLLGQKTTELTIYGKATAAIILAANKQMQLANEFLESIYQYSVATEEMGRYYDTPIAYYSWRDYRMPTEVAAIEAYKFAQPENVEVIDEMRRWILMEKRTHAWSNTLNSLDAAYAFLDGNLEVLDNGEQTKFTMNGKYVTMPKATAGMGYVKTTLPATPSNAFAVEKTSQGTSWGALYMQFMQKTTEVEASASDLSVKREILGDAKHLKVGDRIKVRLTIRAERDLDFVQVTDRRAACMEPVRQLSGYRNGYYCAPQDNQTCYFFDRMAKGTHVIETEYFIDRAGTYETGTCKAQCAYSPEYLGTAPADILVVE